MADQITDAMASASINYEPFSLHKAADEPANVFRAFPNHESGPYRPQNASVLPGFLNLPGEIRNRIYYFCLEKLYVLPKVQVRVSWEDGNKSGYSAAHYDLGPAFPLHRHATALKGTCRQIRKEFGKFQIPLLEFVIDPLQDGFRLLRDFLESLTPDTRRDLRSLKILFRGAPSTENMVLAETCGISGLHPDCAIDLDCELRGRVCNGDWQFVAYSGCWLKQGSGGLEICKTPEYEMVWQFM
ncbi:hypothetical protein EJ08DRAFT_177204 [Tothia fuscella]|uniref:Uncharacterized protein n=1 Tax=Tothia fuscella TaxID=1048955 RepID=A0A9P4NU45_9PEZI|nr:hypothetical protein EJ08DRAFT_177204 [Tothia fuscella]